MQVHTDEEVRLTVVWDRADFWKASWTAVGHRWSSIFTNVVLLAALGAWFIVDDDRVFGVALLVYAAYLLAAVPVRIWRGLSRLHDLDFAPVTYIFTERGLGYLSPGSEYLLTWANLARYTRRQHVWEFFPKTGVPYMVPRRLLTPADEEAVLRVIKSCQDRVAAVGRPV